MITDSEGIVLKQNKTANGRRMLVIFTRKYGKISVGAPDTRGGKNKSNLVTRPFTYGNYELFKNRDNYNFNSGQVIKSFYGLGEDVDKYFAAAHVLEFTEKLLQEEQPQIKLFNLLIEFLEALEKREKKHDTLIMAYKIKAMDVMGIMPELDTCVICGGNGRKTHFCVSEGGMVCENCATEIRAESIKKTRNSADGAKTEPLIYMVDFGIIDILKYFKKEPFSSFAKIALEEDVLKKLKVIVKDYYWYHMDIGNLKSEEFIAQPLKL